MFIPLHDQNALTHVKRQYVTLALIAINIFIWLITATPQLSGGTQANALYLSYGFVPAVINDHAVLPVEYAVLPSFASYITYAFFHADFMHLAGNMLFLWVFGDNVEDAMGHFRFLIFYLLCAAAGAWAHSLAIPQSQAPLIGASGAAAGVVAAYLILHPYVKVWVLAFGRIPIRLSAMWVLGAWIGYQIFSFLTFKDSQVSWAAHLGGIVAGALLVLFLKRSNIQLFDRNLQDGGTSVPVTGGIHGLPGQPTTPKPKTSRDWGRPEDH